MLIKYFQCRIYILEYDAYGVPMLWKKSSILKIFSSLRLSRVSTNQARRVMLIGYVNLNEIFILTGPLTFFNHCQVGPDHFIGPLHDRPTDLLSFFFLLQCRSVDQQSMDTLSIAQYEKRCSLS